MKSSTRTPESPSPRGLCDRSKPRAALAARTNHGEGGRDRGATLVELLVVITLLGTVGVVVLASFAMTLRAASTNDRIAREQAWLASAADVVGRTAHVAGSCSAAADAYGAALAGENGARGWAGRIVIRSMEGWNGSSFAPDAGCTTTQRVTIAVTGIGSAPDRTVQILKVP
jgi:type II secretory pathway pseudopilin PulG